LLCSSSADHLPLHSFPTRRSSDLLARFEARPGYVTERAENGAGAPGRAVDLRPGSLREHAGEVRRDAAAGDVAERVHGSGHVLDQVQELQRVEPRRREERLAPRGAEIGGVVTIAETGVLQDVANERVAVRVDAARLEREDRVARL